MKPVIAKMWVFPSSSGSAKYQTLLYVDGTTSCDCPGWTRRVDANGGRSCKHTRYVECGIADTAAETFKVMSDKAQGVKPRQQKPSAPVKAEAPGGRQFDFGIE